MIAKENTQHQHFYCLEFSEQSPAFQLYIVILYIKIIYILYNYEI